MLAWFFAEPDRGGYPDEKSCWLAKTHANADAVGN
jgi:hypothetical protein